MVESQLALVVTIRDGKIIRSEDYLSHKEALEAVGLQE
jgi:ketosteroid isomerase-like protein